MAGLVSPQREPTGEHTKGRADEDAANEDDCIEDYRFAYFTRRRPNWHAYRAGNDEQHAHTGPKRCANQRRAQQRPTPLAPLGQADVLSTAPQRQQPRHGRDTDDAGLASQCGCCHENSPHNQRRSQRAQKGAEVDQRIW